MSAAPSALLLHWYRTAYPNISVEAAGVPDPVVGEIPGVLAVCIDSYAATGRLVLAPDPPDVVILEWIIAQPTHQRRHGARLLGELLERADQYAVTLRAVPLGMALHLIALYERRGFVRVRRSESWERRPRS